MKTDKFSVLSVVRSYAYGEKTLGLTLSVGVGMGLDIPDCEATARQAFALGAAKLGIKTKFVKRLNSDLGE